MQINLFISRFIESLELEQVSPESILEELPVWDSLAILITIAMVSSDYQVVLNSEEIHSSKTVNDLFNLVKRKQS